MVGRAQLKAIKGVARKAAPRLATRRVHNKKRSVPKWRYTNDLQ